MGSWVDPRTGLDGAVKVQEPPIDFMEQNPSGTINIHSVSQEIPCLLRNSKVHYGVHRTRHWILP